MLWMIDKYKGEIGAVLFFLISATVCFLSDTTFDTGDSITHYLISRKAFSHPEFLLHHWGKPLFTLLSMPFAQFGFKGIELYNCLISAWAAYFAFLTAEKLKWRYAWMVYPLMLFAPKFFQGQLSGLTEPMFALFLIAGLYFVLQERLAMAFVLISFSPFVRTEGFIILIIYGVYALVDRRWKRVPWLFTGLVIYSLIGFFYYGDLLWVFHENPYAGSDVGETNYGHGTLDHYVVQLMYVLGVPFYVLLLLGCVFFVFDFLKRKDRFTDPVYRKTFFLLYGCLIGFVASHSLFWWLGIFNSFGMVRIMISIVPLAAVVAVQALQQLSDGLVFYVPLEKKKVALVSIYLIVGSYVAVFPFTNNPAAYNLNKDFSASEDLGLVKALVTKHQALLSQADAVYFAHPLIEMELIGKIPYEKQVGIPPADELPGLTAGSVVLWDDWFAVMESNAKDSLFQDSTVYRLVDKGITDSHEINVYVRR